MRCRIQFALAEGSRNSPKLRSEQHRHSPRAAAEWDCNQGTGESAGTAPAVSFTSNHEAAGQACCFPITKASTQRVRRRSGHRHVYLGNCSLSRNFSGSLSHSDLSKSSVALTIREDRGPGCRQGCGGHVSPQRPRSCTGPGSPSPVYPARVGVAVYGAGAVTSGSYNPAMHLLPVWEAFLSLRFHRSTNGLSDGDQARRRPGTR